MTNPFVYGEIAAEDAFCDRVEELDRLAVDLAASQKVFLISPRRYGKSSLIGLALRRLQRQGVLTVEIAVSSFSSYGAFLEGYAQAVLSVESRLDRVRSRIAEFLGAVRPELRVEAAPSGASRFAVSFPAAASARDLPRLAQEVFALPARMAEARGRRMAVALDEFQAVHGFDDGGVEHALRDAVQRHRRVGYVFAGSEPSLMERMISPKRPFYKAGPVMRLGKIPPDMFARFLETRFTRTGLRPDAGLGAAILELGANLPYDVQRLAHELWDDIRVTGRRTAGLEDLHLTLSRLLNEQSPIFEARWQRLTIAQRAALRAVVLEGGVGVLAADVRGRRRLGGASSVQSALAALVREEIIAREGARYLVIDSLMREWVARKTY